MLMICHVCAEFHNKKGETVLTVTPEMTRDFITAPEEIREDPLFGMLEADGSIQAGFTEKEKKILEKNPKAGITAEGKRANVNRKKPDETVAEAKAKSE